MAKFEESDKVIVKATKETGIVTWVTGNRITVRLDESQDNEYYTAEQLQHIEDYPLPQSANDEGETLKAILTRCMNERHSDSSEGIREYFVEYAMKSKNMQYVYDSLQTQLTALQAENERLREAQRWIPVSERLPKDGEFVLCCIGKIPTFGLCIYNSPEMLIENKDECWYYELDSEYLKNTLISHWMPLPESPQI
jgi:hypothetical protein